MALRHPRWLAVVALGFSLGGCGVYGDFNRLNPPLANDGTHDWMGPAATMSRNSPFSRQHQLTDDERRLRDLAYPLIEPPYDRDQWYSVVGEYGFLSKPHAYPDRATYSKRLMQTAYRSQTARYNKLMEDIRNDVVRLDPFFGVAQTVADLDRKHGRSLGHVHNLTREEYAKTVQRMRENEAIILWVRESLAQRAASYRFALERLVLAAPSPLAVEAERQLALLQQRMTAAST